MADKPYLSIREVCERFGVDYKTIYRQIQAGALPASKVGGVYRIREDDIAAYAERRRAKPAEPAPAPAPASPAETALAEERIEVLQADEMRDLIANQIAEAQERLRAGEIDVLVTSLQARQREVNAINRFDRKLRELVSVRVPAPRLGLGDSLLVRIAAPERHITRSDESEALMHALNVGYLERAIVDRLPINLSERMCVPDETSQKTRTCALVIELDAWSDLPAHARDGFATRRLALDDLLPRLNQAARQAEEGGYACMLGLASTTGWADDALIYIDNPTPDGSSYSHHLLMPVLVDLTRNVPVYDRRDPRIEPFVGLFSPVMRDERIAAAIRSVEDALLIHDALALRELPHITGAPDDIAQAAVARLAGGGKYRLEDVRGIGQIIRRALSH